MEKKCVKLWFNFVQSSDGELANEDYVEFEVGKKGVISIHDHTINDGTFQVMLEGGKSERIWNPNRAFYETE